MTEKINRICVFTGSNPGARPVYAKAARELGTLLADRQIALVYGGGDVGLMGIIADAVMAAGGKVIGVIPEFLAQKEIANNDVTELHTVQSMHERKALMSELSDGFIALPGGIGTFEELFEIMTWRQLGVQVKPCALLNVAGYFEHMLAMLDHAVEEKFLKPVHRDMLLVGTDAAELLQRMASQRRQYEDKWADKI